MRRTGVTILILIGVLLIIRGMADVSLQLVGEKTRGFITYSTKNYGLRSGHTYTTHYEFTLPNKSLMTGSARLSSQSSDGPRGSINIRYFSFRPSFNSPAGSGLILYGLFWSIPGILMIGYAIKRAIKLAKIRERAAKMHSESGDKPEKGFGVIGLCIVIFIVAIGYFSGIVKLPELFNRNDSDKVAADYSMDENDRGNSQGNTNNGGAMASDGSQIFFINWKDNHKLYKIKPDGTGLVKLTEEAVSCLNYRDGYIYYTNFDDGDKIYRIGTDGKNRKRIYKWKSKDLNLVGDRFYFTNGNDHNFIYSVGLDGKKEKQVNNDKSKNINVSGGWIFYINETDWNKIYKIRPDGTGRQALTEEAAINLLAEDGKLFYTLKSNPQMLFVMNFDATDKKEMNIRGSLQNKKGLKLFLITEGGIDGMNVDGSGTKQIAAGEAWFISILDDKLYYSDFMGDKKIYRTLLDGSGESQIFFDID